MAFINHTSGALVPEKYRVPDNDNIIQVHSLRPPVMKLHYEMYVELMQRESPLSRIQREMVAVLISAINECHYWLVHHSRGLAKLLESQGWDAGKIHKQISLIGENFEEAEIGEAEKSMLRYAKKLTVQPSTVNSSDVVLLRQAGFDDVAIHDLCTVIGYFGFVNRIASGLGVELES